MILDRKMKYGDFMVSLNNCAVASDNGVVICTRREK